MKKILNCVLLVDDNHNDNFFHKREIKKANDAIDIVEKQTGLDAIEYIKSKESHGRMSPDLIFLDINMPVMNGWEFLHEFSLLDKELQEKVIIIMLTTSDSEDDVARAKEWSGVADFITKPLTKKLFEGIITKYFS